MVCAGCNTILLFPVVLTTYNKIERYLLIALSTDVCAGVRMCVLKCELTLTNLVSQRVEKISSEWNVYVYKDVRVAFTGVVVVVFVLKLYTRCFLTHNIYEIYSYSNYTIVHSVCFYFRSSYLLRCDDKLYIRMILTRLCVRREREHEFRMDKRFFSVVLFSSNLTTVRYLVIIMCVHAKQAPHWAGKKITTNSLDFSVFTYYAFIYLFLLFFFSLYYDRPINLFLLSFDFITELKLKSLRSCINWMASTILRFVPSIGLTKDDSEKDRDRARAKEMFIGKGRCTAVD